MPSLAKGYAPPPITPNPFPNFAPQQGGPYSCSGAPVGGTSCVQTVTIGGTPTGGTFTLIFGGLVTGSIAWTATDATLASNIAAALNALPNVGASGVVGAVGTGSSGIGTYTVTFQNQDQQLTVPAIIPGQNNMAGTAPTVAVAVTTAGVSSTLRGSYAGTQIADYTGPRMYTNVTQGNQQSYVRSDCFQAVVPLVAATVTTGGAMGTWQPAEGGPIIICRAMVLISTIATGAANISIGQGSSATTSYTNLIAATSIHSETAPYVIDSWTTQIIAATAAESGIVPLCVVMPAANFVTATASATAAGFVGTLYVWYFKY